MSFYKAGLGNEIPQAVAVAPVAPQKQGGLPTWVGPLAIATMAGVLTVVFSRATGPKTTIARGESMWVKK